MRHEYELIVEAGHILQLDAPDLALERQIMFVDKPLDEFLRRVELHIEAINRALTNIPRERVRLHACWGNWDGPHPDDMDLEPLLPILYQANVGALSLPFANPRHQHEVKLLRRYPLPKTMVLIPGLIDVTTNYLEHPEVVADRIESIAILLGIRHGSLPVPTAALAPLPDMSWWQKMWCGRNCACCLRERRWRLHVSFRNRFYRDRL